MAIEGLNVKERKAEGKKGGVGKIVFLAGAVSPEGVKHGPLPFFEFKVRATQQHFSTSKAVDLANTLCFVIR